MLNSIASNDKESVRQQSLKAQQEDLAHYTGRVKDIFQQADPRASGLLSASALAQVLHELDRKVSQDEVDHVFKLLAKEGSVNHADLVEWLMEEENPDHRALLLQELSTAFELFDNPDIPEDAAKMDDEEGMDMNAMEAEADIEPLNVDLDQVIPEDLWPYAAARMELDETEAEDSYRQAKRAHGGHVTIENLLKELSIDSSEREGLESFMDGLKGAESDLAKAAAGRRQQPASKHSSSIELTMFNKVVRTLDEEKAPPEKGWEFVQAGRVNMSVAEEKVAATYSDRVDAFMEKVRHYAVEPPFVNATAGQIVATERCIAEVDAIIARCTAEGTKFTDTDWDLQHGDPAVLYVDREGPGYDCTVGQPAGYKRLTSIVKNSATSTTKAMGSLFGGFGGGAAKKPDLKPLLFKAGIEAGDIVQGNIGTCFLLGAIGAIASKGAHAIEDMFIKWDVDVGVYGVRINVNGEWSYVIVDDYMPVDEDGNLLFGKCKDPQEVWVPVLEKAFCKKNTCYEMCDGGQASEAICGFMGGVGGKFQVKRVHKRDPSRYFKVLKQAKDRGWLLTTGFMARRGAGGGASGKCGEAVLPTGLVAGHAYSVIKIVEAHGNKLVCCMNPWGSGEWTGKWSDANAFGEWTPEMVEATGAALKDDGKFWMSIEDFVANTTGVDYARTFGANWKKVTQYSHFLEHPLMATAKKSYKARDAKELSFREGDKIEVENFASSWWSGSVSGKKGFFPGELVELGSRPVARFDLTCTKSDAKQEDMKAVVMLLQPNAMVQRRWYRRDEDGLNYKDTSYATVKLFVIGPQGDVAIKKEAAKRVVWGELSLPGGGLWKIYAMAADGKGHPFSLRVYLKGGTGIFREVPGADISEVIQAI